MGEFAENFKMHEYTKKYVDEVLFKIRKILKLLQVQSGLVNF